MLSQAALQPEHAPIGAEAVNRLKWRCRRGLLENDLFIERFFARFETTLSAPQADALMQLMDLSDNDLLDLLLARREPGPELGSADVHALLHLLRSKEERLSS